MNWPFYDIVSKEILDIENYNVPFYNNHIDLVSSHPEIDVVCIYTPNGSHSDISIDVLNYDKHIVIEKPIGLSKTNVRSVIFKALQKHKQVFAVMQMNNLHLVYG